MNYPWLIIAGATCLGWMLPEIGMLCGQRVRVPLGMNFLAAIGIGLIVAGLCL